jgi:hypothetical protein
MAVVSELKNRLQDLPDLPNLSEVDLPRMERVGRNAGRSADETIDRLLGRTRNPIWNWLAVGLGLAIVAGAIAAYMAWMRRPVVEPVTPGTGWKAAAAGKPETVADTGWTADPAPMPEVDVSRLDA